jgi:asparagine synthase (glutamine-hydrolysing)
LSINDLTSAGDQPLFNEDSTLALVFNGEIYNSPELRALCEAKGHVFRSRSDAEVVLHLWELEGIDSLRRLNGIFAFALADKVSGRVVLVRDPLGVKPLFISVGSAGVWFASEPKALETTAADLGDHDTVALAQFLTFLWIPDPRTPRLNCRALTPGHALVCDGASIRDIRWSQLIEEDEPDLEPESAAVALSDILIEAVNRQLLSDVPVGAMVSGGVDSSLLWWAAKGKLSQAYTIDWAAESGAEGVQEDTRAVQELESVLATPVSYVQGRSGEFEALPPSGDLFADPAFELTRLIAKQARADGVKVLFSGQGGDEVFAGYRRHVTAGLLGRVPGGQAARGAAAALARGAPRSLAAEYIARSLRAVTERDPFVGYMRLCSYSTPEDRARALGTYAGEVSDDVVWQRHREVWDALPARWSVLRRARALDLLVYMPGLGLAYADRGGMEFGVEIRVPWLDLGLVRWALRLPDKSLVRRNRTKVVTRDLAAHVLPSDIASRPKRGFGVPVRFLRRDRTAALGSRGFRQGAYFAHAERVLAAHLQR